jgi:hypothetical protein
MNPHEVCEVVVITFVAKERTIGVELLVTHPIKLLAEFGTLRARELTSEQQTAWLIVGLDVHNIHQLHGW